MTYATRVLLALLVLWPLAGRAAETRAFWVWNRDAPLTAPEITALRAGGVTRLYWHVGELVARPGGALAWRSRIAPPPAPADLTIIPTVRLATELRSPELFTAAALAEKLAGAAIGGRVQVDYDCPDRLVPVYAERLRSVRAAGNVPWLSVTALAGWVDKPGFADLRAAADELCPMFYDLDPDPLKPLLDETVDQRLTNWGRACGTGTPWLAGLPAFARVTLRDREGHARGHLRTWAWEDIFFHPALEAAPAVGQFRLFRVARETTVAGQPVAAGETLVARWPDPTRAWGTVGKALTAGARGVVFYRLPRPGAEPAAEDGPSLGETLGAVAQGQPPATPTPALRLRWEEGVLGLENLRPDRDLPPVAGGYALEVEAAGPAAWREALPGEFWRVETGHGGETNGLAARRTFRFIRLPAGGMLRGGLVQFAPGTDLTSLRWRVGNPLNPGAWQPVTVYPPLSPPFSPAASPSP